MINADAINEVALNAGGAGGAAGGGIPVVVFEVPAGPVASASVFRAIKQPAEVVTYGLDYTKFLPSGVGLVSADISITGPDSSLELVMSFVIAVDSMVVLTVRGGTNRRTYKIEVLVSLSNNNRVQDEIFLYVRDY